MIHNRLIRISLVGMACFAASAEDAGNEPMVPLKIELPEPYYGGTPTSYWSSNLEEESFKPRPEFLAPAGTANVAKGKLVTSSDKSPLIGSIAQITDGDKAYGKNSLVELNEGLQWVQIDLEKSHEIFAVLVWHFHEGKRVYFDLVVLVSDDPTFKTGVQTVYNNDVDNSAGLGAGPDKEYVESYRGRLIDAKGVKGRYVRLYTQGNSDSNLNHYVEVEVWGRRPDLVPIKIEVPEPFVGGVPL